MRIRRLALVLIVVWTIAACMSLVWNINRIENDVRAEALVRAKTTLKTDLMYRRWNADQGGVYVPITKDTQPNPYLDNIEERDVSTTDGKQLTLINPAYMNRMVFQSHTNLVDGVQRHLTSLKPIRPENGPDEWEANALRLFEKGTREVSEITYIDGRKHLRYMAPFMTEQACLKCHEKQGYKVGDVRGGISISVPMAEYEKIVHKSRVSMIIGHILFFVVGIIGVLYGRNKINKTIRQLDITQKTLKLTQHAVDSSSDAVFWIREDGCFYYANDEACRRLGYSRNQILKMKVFDISTTATAELWPKMMSILRGNKGDVNITEHITRTGERIPTEVTSNMIVYEGKEYICAFARDITERLKEAEEKERLQGQLLQSQKMEAVGTLASGVAHDFNNMLGIIMGCGQLMADDIDESNPLRTELDIIIGTVNRAKALTSKLLVFSRNEKFKIAPSSMKDVINEVVALVSRSVSRKMEIKVTCEEDLPPVMMDVMQIEQAMINICNNAVDAMADGGTLEIAVRSALKTTLNPDDSEGGKCCVLTFTDTGTGVSAEHLDKLFNPFFTTKESGKGTGLGLSVTHGIINQHGGEIFIGNEPGKGACVTIILPFADIPEDSDNRISPGSDGSGTETIFIVDDEKVIADVTKIMLEKRGYKVIAHTSGMAAVDAFKSVAHEVDVFIADFNMPEIDGLQVLREIKNIKPNVKCVMISGYCENNVMNTVVDQGCRFVEKPFEIEQLCEVIRQIMDS